jgi:hypothetical protein
MREKRGPTVNGDRGRGWCEALAKNVPPGQTLFSNILFFQPELRKQNFFPGAYYQF